MNTIRKAGYYMKRFFTISILCVLFLSFLSFAHAEAAGTYHIIPLQTHDSRVKLRSRPSANGDILGQYYAGTEMTVHEIKNGWAKGAIGGREGYMMAEFLAPSLPGEYRATTMGYIFAPDEDGCLPLYDASGALIARIPEGTVQVLGTIDDKTLHITAALNSQTLTGYASSQRICWMENLSTVTVRAPKADKTVNLREQPATDAPVLLRLYSGVTLHCLFDHHTANDGWTYVHVGVGSSGGSFAGYIMDDYLDFSSDGTEAYRPQPATLTQSSAIITGSRYGKIYQNDPLYILGTAGSDRYPLYYCLASGWQGDGSTYATFTCYVSASLVRPSGSGSISTAGKLKHPAAIYFPDEDGTMQPMEEAAGQPLLYPAGTPVSIWYGTADATQSPDNDLFFGYFTEDTVWVFVELKAPSGSIMGFISIDALEYDPRLLLPGSITNG